MLTKDVAPVETDKTKITTAEAARAMLMRAVAALKADKAKALDEFNNGTGGFLQGDLYVFCANASDGKIVALANPNAKQLIGTDQRNLERAHRQGIRQGIIRCGTEARRTNY